SGTEAGDVVAEAGRAGPRLADLGGHAIVGCRSRTRAGRSPREVTLDVVSPSYTPVPRPALPEAVAVLRGEGCEIRADGVGGGEVLLRLPVDLGTDPVGLDASPLGERRPCRFGSSLPARPGEGPLSRRASPRPVRCPGGQGSGPRGWVRPVAAPNRCRPCS
ncbi:hypothetical protein PV729_34345, partial [Streptomyces europaeiscabiei]|nr:hypothetical protein [Streptomyces europaeiscabiei]